MTQSVVHADETTVQVLKEPGREAESKSYLWLYRTGSQGPPIVLYDYQETREGQHPRDFLKGFKGYLQTDGYAGYHKMPDVILCGCWAHLRRKFDEALKRLPAKKRASGSRAQEAINQIRQLFDMEGQLKRFTPEEWLTLRNRRSRKIAENLHEWLMEIRAGILPKSLLGTAVNYGLNQWENLVRFLEDGCMELDNNRAERSIKPFVIGRKKWVFANTPMGARANATIYSIIETAKQNRLNPYAYLNHLFETLPNLDSRDDATLEELLPWNVKLP